MSKKNIEWVRKMNEQLGIESYKFDSSVIRYAIYDNLGDLIIGFTSGKSYIYFDVPKNVWREFADAESQGKYFNKNIRNSYEYALENDVA